MNLLLSIIISVFLSSCVTGAIIGGTTAKMASDNRPIGQQVDDSIMESKIEAALIAAKDVPYRNISVYTVDGTTYLTGYVSTNEDKVSINRIALSRTSMVVNYIKISRGSSLDYLNTSLITTKIKYEILKTKGISTLGIRVETVLDTIYVFGIIANQSQSILVMEAIGRAISDYSRYSIIDNLSVRAD